MPTVAHVGEGGVKNHQKSAHAIYGCPLTQKYVEFNIELNAKNKYDTTAVHLACENGHSKIAEMLIQKSRPLGHLKLDGRALQFLKKVQLYEKF